MAHNTTTKTSTSSDKIITFIITIVILAVLALAVYATYGKIAANVQQKAIDAENTAIQNGEQEATVRYMAANAGMTSEEYLAQYGLTLGSGIEETTVVSDMTDAMTLENYYKYSDASSGTEEATDVDALLSDWGAAELGITKDTTWKETTEKLPFSKFLGEEQFKSFVEQNAAEGYDVSSITADMSYAEAVKKIQEISAAGPTLEKKEENAEAPAE